MTNSFFLKICIFTSFALTIIIFSSCQKLPEIENPPEFNTLNEQFAEVTSIEILKPETPNIILVQINGYLRDSCEKLNPPTLIGIKEDLINIWLTVTNEQEVCAYIITPFSETVPLNTAELLKVNYTVLVNSIHTKTFNLEDF